jgi:hypothetical protein
MSNLLERRKSRILYRQLSLKRVQMRNIWRWRYVGLRMFICVVLQEWSIHVPKSKRVSIHLRIDALVKKYDIRIMINFYRSHVNELGEQLCLCHFFQERLPIKRRFCNKATLEASVPNSTKQMQTCDERCEVKPHHRIWIISSSKHKVTAIVFEYPHKKLKKPVTKYAFIKCGFLIF